MDNWTIHRFWIVQNLTMQNWKMICTSRIELMVMICQLSLVDSMSHCCLNHSINWLMMRNRRYWKIFFKQWRSMVKCLSMRVNGQKTIVSQRISRRWKRFRLFIIEENHSSNPVDVIHYFYSAQISDNDKVGFELIYARPLRSYVEVNRKQRNLSMSR